MICTGCRWMYGWDAPLSAAIYLVAVERHTEHVVTLRQTWFGNEVGMCHVQRDTRTTHPLGAGVEAIGARICSSRAVAGGH